MHLEEIAGIAYLVGAYLVGAYHVDELTYMTHYLCSYGNHLVIEEPQALIDSYLKQLSEMKAVYQE